MIVRAAIKAESTVPASTRARRPMPRAEFHAGQSDGRHHDAISPVLLPNDRQQHDHRANPVAGVNRGSRGGGPKDRLRHLAACRQLLRAVHDQHDRQTGQQSQRDQIGRNTAAQPGRSS